MGAFSISPRISPKVGKRSLACSRHAAPASLFRFAKINSAHGGPLVGIRVHPSPAPAGPRKLCLSRADSGSSVDFDRSAVIRPVDKVKRIPYQPLQRDGSALLSELESAKHLDISISTLRRRGMDAFPRRSANHIRHNAWLRPRRLRAANHTCIPRLDNMVCPSPISFVFEPNSGPWGLRFLPTKAWATDGCR
jgi:hypothetical protein